MHQQQRSSCCQQIIAGALLRLIALSALVGSAVYITSHQGVDKPSWLLMNIGSIWADTNSSSQSWAPTPMGAGAFAGKGIWWVTWHNVSQADADQIVKASRQYGINTIYVRVADSVNGFYGGEILDQLLPRAHVAGIEVVGWYWSNLHDPSLAITIANYSVSGQKVDAISPDIEYELRCTHTHRGKHCVTDAGPALMAAYFEPIRHGLGDRYPIACTTWPTPRDHGDYAFTAMSKYCQVFTPMTYWRATGLYSTPDGVRRFVDKVFQQYGDPKINPYKRPLSIVAQTYSAGGPGAIPGNPTRDEVTAAISRTRDDGGIGISFWDWSDTNASQWSAIARS